MFERRDYPTIMSGLVVRYELMSKQWDGEINASRDGIGVQGTFPIMDIESCVLFEETLIRARIQQQHMRECDRSHVTALSEDEIDRRAALLNDPNPVFKMPPIRTIRATILPVRERDLFSIDDDEEV